MYIHLTYNEESDKLHSNPHYTKSKLTEKSPKRAASWSTHDAVGFILRTADNQMKFTYTIQYHHTKKVWKNHQHLLSMLTAKRYMTESSIPFTKHMISAIYWEKKNKKLPLHYVQREPGGWGGVSLHSSTKGGGERREGGEEGKSNNCNDFSWILKLQAGD